MPQPIERNEVFGGVKVVERVDHAHYAAKCWRCKRDIIVSARSLRRKKCDCRALLSAASSASDSCLQQARLCAAGRGRVIDLTGQKFGQLECIEEAAPEYWRCHCLRCRYDGALATVDALLTGKVNVCFDCATLERMSDKEKTLAAFKRSLDLSPEREEVDRVDTIHRVASLTIADALSEAA